MSTAEKMKLRKELEKFHAPVKSWKRDDMVLGRWFAQFLERTLTSMASTPTPQEVKEKFPGCDGPDDLVDDLVSATVHEAIVATDAYQENLSGTEIRQLQDRKPGGEQKLTGDVVAMIAEILYTIRLDIDVVFKTAAAYGKMVNAGQIELFEEIFGRALGAFDYDKAKADGNPLEQIGAKIWDRAICQVVGSPLADAQRKGFYCFYVKAIAKETRRHTAELPDWVAPPEDDTGAGAMAGGADEPAAY